jgi:hypothetical protein
MIKQKLKLFAVQEQLTDYLAPHFKKSALMKTQKKSFSRSSNRQLTFNTNLDQPAINLPKALTVTIAI